MSNKFNDLLKASFKSNETEEWLDVHFTRPVGLVFALLWKRLGVHPNAITILSILLGVAAAWMFYYPDVWHNAAGVLLLIFANLCDSTDGQLARLTGQKTLAGRVLDGFAGNVWFFCIYAALCLRMMWDRIPGTDMPWGLWIWALAAVAGIMCHSPQSSLADYYRQIHLFFLKEKEGSELDSYANQRAAYESLSKRGNFLARAFHYNYANYCRSQERRTPAFQTLRNSLRSAYGDISRVSEDLRGAFLDGSRPLIKYTNILTFNTRAICLYAVCLLNCPWVYFLFEITVMNILYIYMHKKHESLCKEITLKVQK